jgi:CSLREA domain-containing protein
VVGLVALVLAVGALPGLLEPAAAGGGQTFTVNRTTDSDDGFCSLFIPNVSDCTLREAINAANANQGADTIAFDINGAGPHTIAPDSELTRIADTVTIDGYTEDDAVENSNATGAINATPRIVVNGANAGAANGLVVESEAPGSVIRGLVVNGFERDGIRVEADDVRIEGSFIGVDATGTSDIGNNTGLFVLGRRATIGGLAPAQRNLISGNTVTGVFLLEADQAVVQGNLIGTAKNGTSNLGTDRNGVRTLDAKNATIGGNQPEAANVIAFNDEIGVAVAGNGSTGVRISRNSIHSNGQLGIDLREDGPTANDNQDPDGGPNRRQNFPKLTSAVTANGATTIKGTLNSNPNTRFTIEIFVSPVGFLDIEATTFVGTKAVKTHDKGKAKFTVVIDPPLAVGEAVTATATNKKTGDTSELSAAVSVT